MANAGLRALGLAAVAGILAACAAMPRQPVSFVGSPLKSLKTGLIVTERTKASQQNLRQGVGLAGDHYDANQLFDELISSLQAAFKTVEAAEGPDQAAAAGADVVAVLDVDIPSTSRVIPSMSAQGALEFSDPSGRKLATISFRSKRSWKIGKNIAYQGVIEDILGSVEKGLGESAPLAAYARSPRAAPAWPKSPQAPAPPGKAEETRSDADEPAYRHPEDPSAFALVVGVEKYSAAAEAPFAERDAAAVRRHLLALGYPERNVILLAGERAGRASLEKYLEEWLPKNVGEGSRVFFYFAGHGSPDTENRQAYLLPFDGDPSFLEHTGYPLKRLYGKLGTLKAREVLVALDAGFSGAGGRSVLPQGTRPLVTKVDGDAPAGRLAVLAAAGLEETAGAEPAQAHGLFTYHLLKALNASRGGASVEELHRALAPGVQDGARRQSREQTPTLRGRTTAKLR